MALKSFGTFLAPFGPSVVIDGRRWSLMVGVFTGESRQDGSGISWL
jgi:hypothetical protein